MIYKGVFTPRGTISVAYYRDCSKYRYVPIGCSALANTAYRDVVLCTAK